jgi:hypothetical protein
MTLSRHPGPCPDLAPLWSEAIRVAIRRFARCARRRVTADVRTDLGPRSLDPDRSFWSAFAERVWDQTSPADFCNCYDARALSPSSHDPRWDGRHDVLPFLRITPPSLARSGDTRRAAHCPLVSIPVPVPPGFRQVFPTAISTRTRHLRRVTPTKLQWRSTCTGQRTKRRTRRRPCVRCFFEPLAPGACASKSACGRRSLPRRPLDIRCRRCVRRQGRSPFADVLTDLGLHSDGVPRRTPSSRRPGCLPPLRARELSDVG